MLKNKPNVTKTYSVVDTKVEFFVAGSNCYFSVGMRIISSTWFEHNVAVVLESSYWSQILHSTQCHI